MYSEIIGDGKQTFRLSKLYENLKIIEDVGPDYKNYFESRKIVKIDGESEYYELVEVPFKEIEEFIIKIDNVNDADIDWSKIHTICEKCRWRGPRIESRILD